MHVIDRVFASLALAALGFVFAGSAMAASASDAGWHAGVIASAGKIHPVPKNAVFMPDRAATYKVVFALTHPGKDATEVSPALERVARTVNLYASAGVPLDHLKFVAIAYGPATEIALDDAHYQQLHHVANPNLPVIRELHQHGIEVAVCGQAVMEHHYRFEWVDPAVPVALSALTTITELQQQGYALMPL
ncbi:MAG: sulfur reduction protein DsrE [Rhodanobacter sp.]|nr:MAG: sulfur reduction protein DsrE [Rhodanobacter sp.]TAM09119.1 MAG: sulfur reduction protein DsrE [Rhodanobacter sp.]TAM35209.1 MAG: sulfur reduction protein DsrE [Rhodanobacter sp.]